MRCNADDIYFWFENVTESHLGASGHRIGHKVPQTSPYQAKLGEGAESKKAQKTRLFHTNSNQSLPLIEDSNPVGDAIFSMAI